MTAQLKHNDEYFYKFRIIIFMAYAPFYEKFPALAEKETRSITAAIGQQSSMDSYALAESYCDELDCDCRRVFFSVMSEKQKKIVAVVAFGWENKNFYAKWLGSNDPQTLKELIGPSLNLASAQSRYAPELLKLIDDFVLQDNNYIERLKRHYALFKEEIGKKRRGGEKYVNSNAASFPPKVGRNMPCPCGSGKKYKKCCLGS